MTTKKRYVLSRSLTCVAGVLPWIIATQLLISFAMEPYHARVDARGVLLGGVAPVAMLAAAKWNCRALPEDRRRLPFLGFPIGLVAAPIVASVLGLVSQLLNNEH